MQCHWTPKIPNAKILDSIESRQGMNRLDSFNLAAYDFPTCGRVAKSLCAVLLHSQTIALQVSLVPWLGRQGAPVLARNHCEMSMIHIAGRIWLQLGSFCNIKALYSTSLSMP